MFTRRDLENKIKEIYEIDEIPRLIDTQNNKVCKSRVYVFRDRACPCLLLCR